MSDVNQDNIFILENGQAEFIDRTSPHADRLSSECDAATIFSLSGHEIGAMFQNQEKALVLQLFENESGDVLPRNALDNPPETCRILTAVFGFGLNKQIYLPGSQDLILCDTNASPNQYAVIKESLSTSKKQYIAEKKL